MGIYTQSPVILIDLTKKEKSNKQWNICYFVTWSKNLSLIIFGNQISYFDWYVPKKFNINRCMLLGSENLLKDLLL